MDTHDESPNSAASKTSPNSTATVLNPGFTKNPLSFNSAAFPVKLTPTNYMPWRAQFTSLIVGYELDGYLDGRNPCPVATKPEYSSWARQDQLLQHALITSISESITPYIVITLKERLQNMRRDSRSVAAYLRDLKTVADELESIDRPLNDDDLTVYETLIALLAATLNRLLGKWQILPPSLLLFFYDCLLDSGANNHVTTDLANLALHSEYNGLDELHIGDESGLKITHSTVSHLPFDFLPAGESLTPSSPALDLSTLLLPLHSPTGAPHELMAQVVPVLATASSSVLSPPTQSPASSRALFLAQSLAKSLAQFPTLSSSQSSTPQSQSSPNPSPSSSVQEPTLFPSPGSDPCAVHSLIWVMGTHFSLKDLGSLSFFLGVKTIPTTDGLFLSQHWYIADLLHQYNMHEAKLVTTPLASFSPLHLTSSSPLSDGSAYQRLLSSLQYLALTRPDLYCVELGISSLGSPALFCDNVGATYLSLNPVLHSSMKHIAIDLHFVRDLVDQKILHVSHISSHDQLADGLTKALFAARFSSLRSKIGVADGTSILRGEQIARESKIHSYGKSFTGFVANLLPHEAKKLSEEDGVISVFENTRRKLHTTRSWDFLRMPTSWKLRNPKVESNIIVALMDKGIWVDSPSFSGKGFGPPPPKWKGKCDKGSNFTGCNKKVIGARYYNLDKSFPIEEDPTPADYMGHGTHTSSTAAGVSIHDASLYGIAKGTARGGVPSARIAMYKVCWSGGCTDMDILTGFDDAIHDGVDLISVSIGGLSRDFFEDPIAIGAFHAMKKRISTSWSAGNGGPDLFSVEKVAPWVLTVGASSMDRNFWMFSLEMA
ncbi:hypothetical protein SLEP1_g45527 [Rubroshorea leprosula]|uniref:Peptidase S8/S53 domain-containing protein n=1 Tax=Rubroshorea leprosula TaxID=152421 RepID=A0AAV5LJE5_9ROSI|nr:hypothetical protein SLEP1_g45527 [Rubroshorea leprosula]